MKKTIKITKAGYVYRNGIKISARKLSPFWIPETLSVAEKDVCRDWVYKHYCMVNS